MKGSNDISMDIINFRNQRKRMELLPYENLTSLSETTMIKNAKKEFEAGWTIGSYDAIFLDKDIPWKESEKISRSWSFHIHCWDMLNNILMAYSFLKDRRYFDLVLKIALDWVGRYKSFYTDATFAWYDMAVGMRAYRLAYIIDVAARLDDVTDDEINKLLFALELHQMFLKEDKNIAFHSNHGFYQAAGQLAMARRFSELSFMQGAIQQAQNRLRKMLELQFSEEGVHLEHSPDYHRMVYETLQGILKSGLLQDESIINQALQIEENLAWFILPNGHLANLGDSDYRMMQRNDFYAAKWSTAPMQFVTSGGALGKPPTESFKVFKKSGYFIVRNTWSKDSTEFKNASYLAQTFAFHSRTHKHADDLSFIWYDRGNEILVDSGRYGYLQKTEVNSELWKQGFWYADPNRVYVESTHAHNTVEIDGQSNPRKGVKPYGSSLERWGCNNGLAYSEGHIRLFKSIRFYRTLVFSPGQWLLVYDWLWDNEKKPHDFRQWFHFAPDIQCIKENNELVVPLTKSAPLRVVSLLQGPTLSNIYRGETKPRMQGWFSPKEREMVPNDAVAFEVLKQPNATFATLFAFGNDIRTDVNWSRVNTSGRKARFRWVIDNIPYELLIERPQEGDMIVNLFR